MKVKKSPWVKEWENQLKKEEKFIAKRQEGPTSVLFKKMDNVIPDKMRSALDSAFFKGFETVFEKGTKVIEKTYDKNRMAAEYRVNEYAYELQENNRTAKTFTKKAKGKNTANMLISTVEGAGMGAFGLALLDIPVFVGMILKSVYEVAMSYGYEYESDEEKIFILKLIEVAMRDGDDFVEGDCEVNAAIEFITSHGDYITGWNISKEEQTRNASNSLVTEMIYTKCIQKIPLVGIIGGLFDPVYVNRISSYAMLKYRRRFLQSKLLNEVNL